MLFLLVPAGTGTLKNRGSGAPLACMLTFVYIAKNFVMSSSITVISNNNN